MVVGPYAQPNPLRFTPNPTRPIVLSYGPNPTNSKIETIAVLKCHYCSVNNIKCEEQKCHSRGTIRITICQKSCSQTPSNQFNVLYTLLQQKGENANQLWSVSHNKNCVQAYLVGSHLKSRRCHFLMHWYEIFNLYASSDTDRVG